MLRQQAEKAAREMMMSEFTHHRYEDELLLRNTLLKQTKEDFYNLVESEAFKQSIYGYIDVLGPNKLRSLKNSIICFITPLCRMAIEQGVDSELAFALSDFYIGHLESMNKEDELIYLLQQASLHYFDLVQSKEIEQYSKPIAMAVRYIRRNLYTQLTVQMVSDYVNLERHYFSSLFTKQVGISASEFITLNKLEDGKNILIFSNNTVQEIAESLGFYDASHFTKRFKDKYGLTPIQFRNINIK